MPGGRPRKPHVLRALEGGRGKSRPMTPDLPAPKSPLVPPPGLGSDERAAWKKHAAWVRSLRLESHVDAGQFEALVHFYCLARRAGRELRKLRKLTSMNKANGRTRLPEVSIQREAWRDYCAIASKFAMDPAARARMGADPATDPDLDGAGDVPPELRDASA